MAKRHALVRKLPAVETLGTTEIIASDKTGTLTQNKMTVEQLYTPQTDLVKASAFEISPESKLTQIMILANDSQETPDGLVGDPTETALIQYYLDRGLDITQVQKAFPRVDSIPFDSERKMMSALVENNGQTYLMTKGAVDEILRQATQIEENGQIRPLTKADKEKILKVNHDLALEALRVLGFAYKPLTDTTKEKTAKNYENDLIFVGLIGMIDPERPEVKDAVAEAKSAGIRPLMITGDHKDTARAIALRLGIITPEDTAGVITGRELDAMSDEELKQNVDRYSVYARVAPEHKVRIVKAWQAHGKIVAMTGDGVNDAPALKTADIGVGMGITGTEVSKNADRKSVV